MLINTETELEELLSRPTEADAAALAALEGDLLILGAGGKMGPSLARLARRACNQASVRKRIVAVSRFSTQDLRAQLEADGVETIASDLLETGALKRLPDAQNVLFMVGRKFGTGSCEPLTWVVNTFLPGVVAERYRDSRIAVLSTGNVYPLRLAVQGGADESCLLAPVGEYAQSAVGRERMFEYASQRWNTRVAILRLNYAIDLRYGVLLDIGTAVYEKRPVDLRMPLANVIWQGDANSACLRSLTHCQSPPLVLNLTGPETLSVRYIAEEFGRRFHVQPVLAGEELPSALLSNAARCHQLLGYPKVSALDMIEWTARWIAMGGRRLGKPTNFQTRDGRF